MEYSSNDLIVDKIFYINLDRRVDRNKEFLDQYEVKKFPIDKLERFPAIERKIGAIGCSESHLSVLKIAKQRGYKTIIVFEDDFQMLVTGEKLSEMLGDFFKNAPDYRVLMLSPHCLDKPTIYNDLISITHDCQTTSGYVVNMKYIDELIGCMEYGLMMYINTEEHWNYAVDQIWKCLQQDDKWFLFNVRVGKQRKSWSDLSNSIADYNF